MIFIRYLFAIALFITGIFCLINFFIQDFNWLFLLATVVCFVLAYWVKPTTRHRHESRRHQDQYDWLDWIDWPIDFLFQVISLPFRLIFRIFDNPSIDL